jgi:small-conductance mechanosensitive channel
MYDLLRWAGVDDATAAHVQQVLLRPVSVVLVVIVALLAAWLGNRFIRHWIGGAVRRAAIRADSPRAERRAVTLTTMLANIWRVVVAFVAFFIVLGVMGINLTPILAGATIIGATIGFGAQSVVKDFLSGFLLTVEGQYDIGDTVRVGNTTGVVEDLSLRVTRLRAPDGGVWYVPNGDIRLLGNTVRGWGRATVDIPVPLTTDVDHLLDVLGQSAEAVRANPAFTNAFMEAPVVWGLVDATVDSMTGRITVRAPFDQRESLERAIRNEVFRRLETQAAPPSRGPGPASGGPAATPDS